MANEIELITTNENGDSWVDLSPGLISSGYQAQNTNLEASRLGLDASSPYYDSVNDRIYLPVSGIVDDDSLPFVIKTEFYIDASSMIINVKYYLRLIAGTTTLQRSVALTTDPGTWDSAKMGYYVDGYRVLNSVLIRESSTVVNIYRRINQSEQSLILGKLKGTGDVSGKTLSVLDRYSSFIYPSSTILSSFTGSASGLAFDPTTGNLIRAVINGDIFIHDGVTSTTLSSFSPPGIATAGLAFDSTTGNLISCTYDGSSYSINIHDGITSTILSSFSPPGSQPTDIAFDSETGNLLSCDLNASKVYIHDGITATILSSFSSPTTGINGLTIDTTYHNLISQSNSANKIYTHKGISSTVVASVTSSGEGESSLTFDSINDNLISGTTQSSPNVFIHSDTLTFIRN